MHHPLMLFLIAMLSPLLPQMAPAWVGRCLSQLRPSALEHGAPLPNDSPRNADHGLCAAQCDAHCFLTGDFDGDGRARELAVASSTQLLLFHDVERGKGRRFKAQLVSRLLLGGEEVALLSARRAARFVDEVGLLRDGKSPLPLLPRNERMAFGVILWHGGALEAEPSPDEEEHGRGGESGELLLAIFDQSAQSYRLQRVLLLGSP